MYVCLYFVLKMAPGLTPWLSSRRTWGPLWVLSWVSCAWVPSPQSSSTLVLFFPFFFFWFNFFFVPYPEHYLKLSWKHWFRLGLYACFAGCPVLAYSRHNLRAHRFYFFLFFFFFFILYIYFFCLLPWTLSLIIVKALIQIRPRYFLVNIRSPL